MLMFPLKFMISTMTGNINTTENMLPPRKTHIVFLSSTITINQYSHSMKDQSKPTLLTLPNSWILPMKSSLQPILDSPLRKPMRKLKQFLVTPMFQMEPIGEPQVQLDQSKTKVLVVPAGLFRLLDLQKDSSNKPKELSNNLVNNNLLIAQAVEANTEIRDAMEVSWLML